MLELYSSYKLKKKRMNFHSAFTQSTCQKVRHHPVPEVFRRKSGVRILMLDVIIYLHYYLSYPVLHVLEFCMMEISNYCFKKTTWEKTPPSGYLLCFAL